MKMHLKMSSAKWQLGRWIMVCRHDIAYPMNWWFVHFVDGIVRNKVQWNFSKIAFQHPHPTPQNKKIKNAFGNAACKKPFCPSPQCVIDKLAVYCMSVMHHESDIQEPQNCLLWKLLVWTFCPGRWLSFWHQIPRFEQCQTCLDPRQMMCERFTANNAINESYWGKGNSRNQAQFTQWIDNISGNMPHPISTPRRTFLLSGILNERWWVISENMFACKKSHFLSVQETWWTMRNESYIKMDLPCYWNR